MASLSEVEKIVRARDTALDDLSFVAIEKLSLADYARVLKESAIYAATSTAEGFPRSLVEAMACGCLCLGFHGIGGRDYIVDAGDRQNFIPVESMNFIELSRALLDLAARVKNKDPALELIRTNAIKTAAAFTPEAEKRSVLAFWEAFCPA